jgi:hypothetical protein
MDSTTSQALANATKLNNDLFELVEKQRIQLDKKDEELANEKQEKQVYKLFACLYRTIMTLCSEIVSRFGDGKSSSR